MKRVYPTFIVEGEQDYLVFVPDMDIYTEGKSMVNAIEMARDAIGLKGIDIENEKKELPNASSCADALKKAPKDIDFSKGTLTLVDVDFTAYRRRMENKMVRRNVTLPNWMNEEAERLGINVSRVLQEALAAKIEQIK